MGWEIGDRGSRAHGLGGVYRNGKKEVEIRSSEHLLRMRGCRKSPKEVAQKSWREGFVLENFWRFGVGTELQ